MTTSARFRAPSRLCRAVLSSEQQAPDHVGKGPADHGKDKDDRSGDAPRQPVAAAGAGGWLLLRSSGARANTIAVLPFANLSGDPSQSYFSDGIAEEVRSALAGLGGVEVVARTSSEMLRNADAVTAARRLSVANVVTGSVRRSPSTVRVSAQLVDGRNGLERWSQTFDRPLGDVLQIQTDIAANVARALSIQLSGPAADALSIGGTSNPQAQDVLLQALDLEGGDDSSEGMLRRIALFERATQLDPNYAQAHARKGLTQTLWANAWAPSNADKYSTDAEALRSIRRAIAIAPAMPLGYSALGLVYFNQLMLKPSLEALSRSVQLAGADSLAFLNYSVILCRLRRQAEAEAAAERAISVDPLNATAWQIKTWTLFLGRRYPQSIDAARQTLSIAPENRRARTLLAWDLLFLGRTDEAVSELQHVPADDYRRFVAEGAMAARSNRREDALRAIQGLEKRYGDTVHYQLAEIYAQLGDGDKAVANLEAAWLVRDSGLATLQVDPFLDPVRNDPRFSKIAARLFG